MEAFSRALRQLPTIIADNGGQFKYIQQSLIYFLN